MNKHGLLHPELAQLVTQIGHTDELTVCDAGLPIPNSVSRIDLALTQGVPSFMQTVEAVLAHTCIESVVIAEELAAVSPALHQALLARLEQESAARQHPITVTTISHEAFKARTVHSKAVVRTGECTPYANVIFQAGVTF
ncbi:D-ribose pyranase [Salinivibrio sharmensis]|uniref:D-ribose pyranase n=1 Tax=Salinivibrio sharmensis TaxID=390883 RepID=A0ABX3KI51_9GAMM|nr:D-ribose pyranase [Salinivibrio sharmensis]OOE88673.1 D-ribose pyranase [Salinivibrio sharmensis]